MLTIMPFTPYVLHHKMKDNQDYIWKKKDISLNNVGAPRIEQAAIFVEETSNRVSGKRHRKR